MSRKKAIRVLFVAAGVLAGIAMIIAAVFASTSSSSDALALARAAAVARGFKTDELDVQVEFTVKGSDPLQSVRIDVSRGYISTVLASGRGMTASGEIHERLASHGLSHGLCEPRKHVEPNEPATLDGFLPAYIDGRATASRTRFATLPHPIAPSRKKQKKPGKSGLNACLCNKLRCRAMRQSTP